MVPKINRDLSSDRDFKRAEVYFSQPKSNIQVETISLHRFLSACMIVFTQEFSSSSQGRAYFLKSYYKLIKLSSFILNASVICQKCEFSSLQRGQHYSQGKALKKCTHENQALFTRYWITYVSDPVSYQIGVLFIRLCMNPIRSAATIRYNPASYQQVAWKWIRYNPYRFDSCVNIVIQYETLPNLALIMGWLQYKWG